VLILGGLMEQTFNLDLSYAIHVIQEYYACLIETWRTTQENVQPQGTWLCLG
jgi:hypothetical protein